MMSKSLFLLLILLGTVTLAAEDYTNPPADSAEADRVRIWVPVERTACQTRINIVTAEGDTVRHFNA